MLTVSILNYNGKGILEKSLSSVLKQSHKPDEILIIDNNSTDDSWKIVQKDLTRVVHADNRHQFITGLNVAFKEAKNDTVLFMENDVYLHADLLQEMNWMVNYGKSDIVSPHFYDSNFHKFKIEWYSGFLSACFMMRKSTFDFIGTFDTNLAPAYFEDVDYTIRAHQLGFKTKKGVGKAIHYANWSFSKVYSKKQMSWWCRRNAWYVLKKHYLSHVFPSLCNEKIVCNNS